MEILFPFLIAKFMSEWLRLTEANCICPGCRGSDVWLCVLAIMGVTWRLSAQSGVIRPQSKLNKETQTLLTIHFGYSLQSELSKIQQDNGCMFQSLTPGYLDPPLADARELHHRVTQELADPFTALATVSSQQGEPLRDWDLIEGSWLRVLLMRDQILAKFHPEGETPQQVSHEVGPGCANSPERKRDMSKPMLASEAGAQDAGITSLLIQVGDSCACELLRCSSEGRACLWDPDSEYLQPDEEVAEHSSALAKWFVVVLALARALQRLTANEVIKERGGRIHYIRDLSWRCQNARAQPDLTRGIIFYQERPNTKTLASAVCRLMLLFHWSLWLRNDDLVRGTPK
ncbi:hypothetical protein Q9233_005087 [Columba guinea]|nr:hypothetical protein Q9233_005087 [Columba guinea]